MSPADSGGEAITAQGLDSLQTELHELETTARRQMAARIKFAREMGDLKENAEYHMAKDAQAHLETKIERLTRRLADAVVVEVDRGGDTFAFGRTAEVLDVDGARLHAWTIVGATEANLAQGRLSGESPVGRALVGRNEGDTVEVPTPRGPRTYRIERLLP